MIIKYKIRTNCYRWFWLVHGPKKYENLQLFYKCFNNLSTK